MLVFCLQLSSSHWTWISQSKCPMLQTIASFFICTKCLPVRMSLQPVVVTKMLHLLMQSSTVVTSSPPDLMSVSATLRSGPTTFCLLVNSVISSCPPPEVAWITKRPEENIWEAKFLDFSSKLRHCFYVLNKKKLQTVNSEKNRKNRHTLPPFAQFNSA